MYLPANWPGQGLGENETSNEVNGLGYVPQSWRAHGDLGPDARPAASPGWGCELAPDVPSDDGRIAGQVETKGEVPDG